MPKKKEAEADTRTPVIRKRRIGSSAPLKPDERRAAQDIFIDVFSKLGIVTPAAERAGVSRSTIYEWLERDEQFSMRFRQAEQMANDRIRQEIVRRAVTGYEKPVVNLGKVVMIPDPNYPNDRSKDKPLMERVYSDNLLALLAKSKMQEFREKSQLDVTSNGNTVGQVNMTQLADMIRNTHTELVSWREERGLIVDADEI